MSKSLLVSFKGKKTGLRRKKFSIVSPLVRESKTFIDSGFHAVDSGLRVPHSSVCQWNLDSGVQSLVGFWFPSVVFRIPKPSIPDSTFKIF